MFEIRIAQSTMYAGSYQRVQDLKFSQTEISYTVPTCGREVWEK